MTTWIIRTVKFEDTVKPDGKDKYLVLLCSEYDCDNYRYRYISKVPNNIVDIIALAVFENPHHYISDLYRSLKDDDMICHYGADVLVEFGSIKEKIESKIEELEEEEQ